jgi:transcriptional regulator with XRE-family HTH domain
MENRITYDVNRLREDMALRGWMQNDLARAANVVPQTVSNFISGKSQTAKTAGKLARALGYTVRRYLISNRKAVA